MSPETDLQLYFGNKYQGTGAIGGINLDDAEYIDKLLSKFGLSDFIKVDEEKLRRSHEAWIYVTICTDAGDIDLLKYFPPDLEGVITWSNSD